MSSSLSQLTQSQYYSPVFNSAIFDGIFRIYFAQQFEAHALKLYFQLQKAKESGALKTNSSYDPEGSHIFILIYPTSETFRYAFGEGDWHRGSAQLGRLGSDWIFGLLENAEDSRWEEIIETLNEISKDLPVHPGAEATAF